MLKIKILTLFLFSFLLGRTQNNITLPNRVLNTEFSSGLFLLNGISNSNIGYRFDYGSMVINPKINIGLNFYFGFTNSSQINYETAYQDYFLSSNGYDYVNGFITSKVKSDLRLINLGGYYSFNKYITGNYFDGGLYATLGIGVDYFNLITSNFEIVSSEASEIYSKTKKYFNFEEGSIIGGTALLKLGYDFPLSNMNFGVFASIDKSFFKTNTRSKSLIDSETIEFETPGYTIVRFGIRLSFIGYKY
jgi:hypothetical protein